MGKRPVHVSKLDSCFYWKRANSLSMISAVLIMILYRKQTDSSVKPSNTKQERPKKITKALKERIDDISPL